MEQRRYGIDAAITACILLFLILMLAGTFLPLRGDTGSSEASGPSAATITDIDISFKLDQRLTRGVYMGDRWISPSTYTGTAGQDTVEARAHGLDAGGIKVAISPEWVPSDPQMVAVSPSEGAEVTITVERAGESRLRITAGEVSTELAIEARYSNDVMQVEIVRLQTDTPPAEVSQDPVFQSEKEKLSYALGVNVGSGLRRQSIDVDQDLVIQGFQDALSGGTTLLSEAEVRVTLFTLQSELKTKQAALLAEQKKELDEKNKADF